MKTTKSLLISLLFIPVLAFAHEPVALPNAGLTPESAFYFVDKIGEALREFFTFNPEGKAHLQIDFAAERIAEIKIILETKGVNAKGLEVAQSRLQANIAKAAGIVEGEKSKGKDVSELAKNISEDFDANKEALKQAFKDQERSLEAKEDRQKVLDEAAEDGVSVPAEAFEKFDWLLAQAKELFTKENYVGAKQLAKQAEDALEKVEEAIEDLDEAKEEEEELKEEQEERAKEGNEKEGQRQKEAEKQQEEAEEQGNE